MPGCFQKRRHPSGCILPIAVSCQPPWKCPASCSHGCPAAGVTSGCYARQYTAGCCAKTPPLPVFFASQGFQRSPILAGACQLFVSFLFGKPSLPDQTGAEPVLLYPGRRFRLVGHETASPIIRPACPYIIGNSGACLSQSGTGIGRSIPAAGLPGIHRYSPNPPPETPTTPK